MKQPVIDLVVVFRKETDGQTALSILDNTGFPYRKGMDSSKGKVYFYSTGPKFIMIFGSEQNRETTASLLENTKEVYEVYIPDWEITKD